MSDDKLLTMREATLAFLTTASSVTLAKMLRGPFAGYLNGYGGVPEPGDSDRVHTTLRELEEESGVRAERRDVYKKAVIDFYNHKDGRWIKCRVYVSLLRYWSGVPTAGDGMGEPKTYSFDHLPLDQMLPADPLWLPRMLSGELLVGEAWYNPGHKSLHQEPRFSATTADQLDRLWKS